MRRIARSRIAFAALCLPLVFALACGSDDDDPEPSGEDPTAVATATVEEDGATACADTPYTVSLRAADGANVAIDNDAFEVASAKAIRLADGAAYTIYLAGFELDEDDISPFSAPVPPEGGTMVTIFLTTFNAEDEPEMVEAGTVIEYTPDFGVLTFRVISQMGGQLFNSSVSAAGTVTIEEAGDYICGTIEYTDSAAEGSTEGQNRVAGTFSAEVIE